MLAHICTEKLFHTRVKPLCTPKAAAKRQTHRCRRRAHRAVVQRVPDDQRRLHDDHQARSDLPHQTHMFHTKLSTSEQAVLQADLGNCAM